MMQAIHDGSYEGYFQCSTGFMENLEHFLCHSLGHLELFFEL
jgi:hypothetical protein